jgi:molybdopterin synthase catalytic subunit
VLGIDYEAYAPMAERVLHTIAAEAARRWPVRGIVIEHRIGPLAVGDASVAIVLSTPHRAEGFEALRFAIETLKQDVPIWKRERFEDGDVWVQEGS